MKRYCLIALLLFGGRECRSQQIWPACPLLAELKQQAAYDVSYDYTVMLRDLGTAQKLDSLSGHLVYSRQRFIDSNTFSFHARTADAYCKLDFTDRTAVAFKLDDFFKKMKIKFADEPNHMDMFAGDYLSDPGNRVVCDDSNPFFNRVKIYPADDQLLYAQVDFRKADNACIGALLEWKETEDDGHAWKKIMHIYNVSNRVPESAFDLSRIISFRQGKPVLSGKYAQYKMIQLF